MYFLHQFPSLIPPNRTSPPPPALVLHASLTPPPLPPPATNYDSSADMPSRFTPQHSRLSHRAPLKCGRLCSRACLCIRIWFCPSVLHACAAAPFHRQSCFICARSNAFALTVPFCFCFCFEHSAISTSHVTRHSSHVTRHTSHVTRHTSHVTHHTSHITRRTSHVTRHTSHVTRHTSHITHHTSLHALPPQLRLTPADFRRQIALALFLFACGIVLLTIGACLPQSQCLPAPIAMLACPNRNACPAHTSPVCVCVSVTRANACPAHTSPKLVWLRPNAHSFPF